MTRQEWVKDTDWVEIHLTPRGWRDGTYVSDKGYRFRREPPHDRLMTIRCFEYIPADPNRGQEEWSEIYWRTDNTPAIERAQNRWGVLPSHSPPLSAESAAEHIGLKNIRVMRLPSKSAPVTTARPRT